jgi:hypothetical protein
MRRSAKKRFRGQQKERAGPCSWQASARRCSSVVCSAECSAKRGYGALYRLLRRTLSSAFHHPRNKTSHTFLTTAPNKSGVGSSGIQETIVLSFNLQSMGWEWERE